MRRIKLLLTDGSSPAALQAIAALGRGYVLDVCDPHPLRCPARYSCFVRRVLRCPAFGASPISYADFLARQLKAEHYDVLFPTHDQVYLLSRFRKEFESLARLPVPDFAAVEQIRDPSNVARLLNGLGLAPAPAEAGTAASIAQAVFQHGRLLAYHASQVRRRAADGMVIARQALHQPAVRDDVTRLGARLNWHGALQLEFATDRAGGPRCIRMSARLGETFNALAAGVNLPQWLVRVALATGPLPALTPRRAQARRARTHDLIAALVSQATQAGARRPLLRELADMIMEKGSYAKSRDERIRRDGGFLYLVPTAAAIGRLLLQPQSARMPLPPFADSYTLSESTVRIVRKLTGKLL